MTHKNQQDRPLAPAKGREAPTAGLMAAALSAAVPLIILEFYDQNGPDVAAVKEARAFGQTLGSKGDLLLFRSTKPGETAQLFNGFARAIAVLSFVPGGVPPLFGVRWCAEDLLGGFIGQEAAAQYCQRIRSSIIEAETFQEQRTPHEEA